MNSMNNWNGCCNNNKYEEEREDMMICHCCCNKKEKEEPCKCNSFKNQGCCSWFNNCNY